MVDATFSVVIKRLAPMIEKKVREEVGLLINSTDEANNLSTKLKTIQKFLMDAERKAVTDPKVKSWLDKLQDISYEIDDALDEWDWDHTRLLMEGTSESSSDHPWEKISSFLQSVCLCFRKVVEHRSLNLNIKQLNERLDEIGQENEKEFKFVPNLSHDSQDFKRIITTSRVYAKEVHGRDDDKEILVSMLRSEGSNSQMENGVPVISIVGAGGMGKTTLTQLMFNDDRVKDHFQVKIWVCVSHPFDEIKIAKAILEALNKSSPNLSTFESLLQCIVDNVSGKNFLLVLDDVWTQDDTMWKPLRISLNHGGPKSRILVTTRNTKVAGVMGSTRGQIQSLSPLLDSDCWSVLSQIAFNERTKWERKILKETGLEIVKKCKGLPLAAKVIGSLLSSKKDLEQWQNVLESQVWELEKARTDIFPFLVLSYEELHPVAKRCFSYCAIFPKDTKIEVDRLIRMWCAQGFLSSIGSLDDEELRGREIFDDLAMRSFFQDFKKDDIGIHIVYCKMHDIVHDFAQFLTKNECLILENVGGGAKLAYDQNARHLNLLEEKNKVKMHDIVHDFAQFLNKNECLILENVGGGAKLAYDQNARHLNLLEEKNKVNIDPILVHHEKCRSFLTRKYAIPPKLLSNLKRVRVLILDECYLEAILREIGSLIHLRYLDLTRSDIRELPETICDLYNLETLILVGCEYLRGLPQGIHKLKNLRHLLNHGASVEEFPEGIAELTNLWTLSKVNASSRRSRKNLGLLRNMNRLRGSLYIIVRGSDNEDDLVEAAEKANLKNKKFLRRLKLTYRWNVQFQIIEALQPHPDLQSLDFDGPYLPDWVSTLTNLRELELLVDVPTKSFPSLPLGKLLPFLESLLLNPMSGMERLSHEFLGIDTHTPQPTTSYAFQSLKILTFIHCDEWQEWEDICEEEENNLNISIFPSLERLKFFYCQNLKALPHRILRKASSLKHLEMIGCDNLRVSYKDWERVSQLHKISHIPTSGVTIW